MVFKLSEGRPNIIDEMKNGNINLIFNTPLGKDAYNDDTYIRKTATSLRIPLVTTVQAIFAMAEGLDSLLKEEHQVKSLQEYFHIK